MLAHDPQQEPDDQPHRGLPARSAKPPPAKSTAAKRSGIDRVHSVICLSGSHCRTTLNPAACNDAARCRPLAPTNMAGPPIALVAASDSTAATSSNGTSTGAGNRIGIRRRYQADRNNTRTLRASFDRRGPLSDKDARQNKELAHHSTEGVTCRIKMPAKTEGSSLFPIHCDRKGRECDGRIPDRRYGCDDARLHLDHHTK